MHVIQNKTNSENRHLVFLIFKKEQENDGVGDISSLFQRHCQTLFFLEYQEYKMSIFGICFILYFLKLSACRGFRCMLCNLLDYAIQTFIQHHIQSDMVNNQSRPSTKF